MFDWLKVKSTLEGARNECQKMRATIVKNNLRIEELRKLPLPKEELIELASKWIDDFGSDYPQLLQAELNIHMANPIDPPNMHHARFSEQSMLPIRILGATEQRSVQATTKTIERALFYILGDQLKAGVRRAVQEMEYPTIVGPAMPKRMAEINNLMTENTSLQAQIDQIETGLTDAGVVHTAVQSQKPARKGDTGVYPPV